RELIAALSFLVDEGNLLVSRTVEDHAARALGQLLERGAHVDAEMARHALEHRLAVLGAALLAPGRDGALGERETRVGDDEVGVEIVDRAEAAARSAGAVR